MRSGRNGTCCAAWQAHMGWDSQCSYFSVTDTNPFNCLNKYLCGASPTVKSLQWYQRLREICGLSLNYQTKEFQRHNEIKKCVLRPRGTHTALLSLPLVILHQRFPQWQCINALTLSPVTVFLPLSLSHLFDSLSLSFAVAPPSFLWKCQWTVAAGPKNTCPLTMFCDASFCQLPDPFEPTFLAHLHQSHFFLLEVCHTNLAVPNSNMTRVSRLNVTTLESQSIWL